IATGTKPAMPDNVPFEANRVFTSDGLLGLDRLPKSMIVVGGGVIGTEYACMMATLGVKVTLVEGRRQVLGFVDEEITEAMQYHMRQTGITLRLGEKVKNICVKDPEPKAEEKKAKPNGKANDAATDESASDTDPNFVSGYSSTHAGGTIVVATLESGKTLRAESLLYAVGRQGTVTAMHVDKAGIKASDRERLKVNEHFQTDTPHIYAMGDVIGFPALASTSMEQGRLAACHAFGVRAHSIPELFPFGIYAIPEISMVGKTEEQLTDAGIPYEAGVANYKEIARGQLLGDEQGMLKLLIHQENRGILGVHAIGTGATELIHIGQTAMALGGKIDFFVNNVFNYPTLAETYKVAALNGMNKLRLV
ncbi:MAG: FAD-dependent oxidoreductase, partial [Planctomycetota bacterium]